MLIINNLKSCNISTTKVFQNTKRIIKWAGRSVSQQGAAPTMKYLCVAEKNDAAKHIAGYLSRGSSKLRKTFSKYNQIYEFETQILGVRSKVVMTSVSGHLLTFSFTGIHKSWAQCTPISLFDAPLTKTCLNEDIKKTLQQEIRTCQGLIIWTDCDREGENIGAEIIEVCSETKSNLKIYRAKFSEITQVSIQRAISNLGQLNKNMSDAVDVRQQLDLKIGAAFTRFQTLRLTKMFPDVLDKQVISYGSCQFPTLGFIVERYRAVENFQLEPFWKIRVVHTIDDSSVEYVWSRNRLFDMASCVVIFDICKENPIATVTNVTGKPKSKWRPLPLDTVELEKLGSRKLGLTAKETMKIAEGLYTKGIISYPRTETNIFPKELNLTPLVEMQTPDRDWGDFARRILSSGGPTPRAGKKSDQAHPPIHPTKYINSLSGNDKKVYDFIVRSFLACCSKDAQGFETTVNIQIAEEQFSASGLMVTAKNYLEVYPYEKWSDRQIHEYQQGQQFTPTIMDIVEGKTSAPKLLTEADLIGLMEKHGIGTDATHAEHIEKLKTRQYAALVDNHFVPGLLGIGLIDGYDAIQSEQYCNFAKPYLRAALEIDLNEICEGRKLPNNVLEEQLAIYKEVFLTVSQKAQALDSALSVRFNKTPQLLPTVMKCPKCGADMVIKKKENDNSVSLIFCSACSNTIWLKSNIREIEVTNIPCNECGPNIKKLNIKWNQQSLGHFHPNPICIGGCDENILNILGINKNRFNTGNQSQPNSTSAVDRFNSNRNLGNLFNSGRTFNRSTTQTSNNTNRNQTANVRSKRKCGICRQEGHTRNNCPQNN